MCVLLLKDCGVYVMKRPSMAVKINSPSKRASLYATLRDTIREVWAIRNAVRVSHVYLMSIPLLTKLRS